MNLPLWKTLFPNTIDLLSPESIENSIQQTRLLSFLLEHGIRIKTIEEVNGLGYRALIILNGEEAFTKRVFDVQETAFDFGIEEALRSIELNILEASSHISEKIERGTKKQKGRQWRPFCFW